MSNEMNTQEEKKVLTQKDLNKAMFRWYMSAEMPLNFENMQGIAFCGSISHILKKLYTKKEDLSEALKRHLLLYNCNVTAGGLILGTTIAMEEQRAKDPSKMPDMAITGLKTHLCMWSNTNASRNQSICRRDGDRSTDFHGRENGMWNRCMLSLCLQVKRRGFPFTCS